MGLFDTFDVLLPRSKEPIWNQQFRFNIIVWKENFFEYVWKRPLLFFIAEFNTTTPRIKVFTFDFDGCPLVLMLPEGTVHSDEGVSVLLLEIKVWQLEGYASHESSKNIYLRHGPFFCLHVVNIYIYTFFF